MNSATISAVVASDPDLKFVESGATKTPVCRFLLSVVDRNGNANELEAQVWGVNAELFSEEFRQGQSGVFTGRLRIETRESTSGLKNKVPQLVISQYFKAENTGTPKEIPFRLLDSPPVEPKKDIATNPSVKAPNVEDAYLDDIPF